MALTPNFEVHIIQGGDFYTIYFLINGILFRTNEITPDMSKVSISSKSIYSPTLDTAITAEEFLI